MVASAGCLSMPLLRHHLAPFSAKLFAINSSRIPPQPKPPSGAKSGLCLTAPPLKKKIAGSEARRFQTNMKTLASDISITVNVGQTAGEPKISLRDYQQAGAATARLYFHKVPNETAIAQRAGRNPCSPTPKQLEYLRELGY